MRRLGMGMRLLHLTPRNRKACVVVRGLKLVSCLAWHEVTGHAEQFVSKMLARMLAGGGL